MSLKVASKTSLILASLVFTAGLITAPTALAHNGTCKTKAAAVHKAKAKSKVKLAKVHKRKGKAKVIKVADKGCECKTVVKVVKVVQPVVVEQEVTVYRAEPRPWHAPYVDEVISEAQESEYTTHQEYSERRVHTQRYAADYLAVDTRPRDDGWTRW